MYCEQRLESNDRYRVTDVTVDPSVELGGGAGSGGDLVGVFVSPVTADGGF